MRLVKTKQELMKFRKEMENTRKLIGFVPTMGALHQGHLSLVEEACEQTDSIFVSIFVNPTQFNDPADLKIYPRNLDKDLELLSAYSKIDIVFIPGVKEIYPFPDQRIFDFGYLDKIMEGAYRPGHFNGVAQIVSIFFDLVRPDKVFFGQKDFQQVVIIRDLIRQLKYNIELVSCPIIREPDGLAMSSRNQQLNPEERKHAALIYRVLFMAKTKANQMDVNKLKEWITFVLKSDPLIDVEYVEIVDSLNLKPVNDWKYPGQKVCCIAVRIGKVRLIDNLLFP